MVAATAFGAMMRHGVRLFATRRRRLFATRRRVEPKWVTELALDP
jgi:hypothetical protein